VHEVSLCPSEDCEFYPIRFGKSKKGYSVLKAIKRKCRDCGEGTFLAVKNCEFPDCQVYFYRMGKNPTLKGKRGKGRRDFALFAKKGYPRGDIAN